MGAKALLCNISKCEKVKTLKLASSIVREYTWDNVETANNVPRFGYAEVDGIDEVTNHVARSQTQSPL